jgi:predicted phosphodiesterase
VGDKNLQLELPGTGPVLCFGGPYSNIEATRAIREQAGRLDIPASRVICTGDIVAYCANPNETAQEIRDWGCHVIKGNCEEQLALRADDCGCGFGEATTCDLLSRGWYSFADAHLTDDLRGWMASLPTTLAFEFSGHTFRVIHGGISQINRFIFPSTPAAEKSVELDAAKADIIIAGHSGIPFVEPIGNRLWFNPGVIGMPANDGTRDAWFGIITPETNAGIRFALKRLPYAAETAAATLLNAGFATPYAEALLIGRWPSIDILPAGERLSAGRPVSEAEYLLR